MAKIVLFDEAPLCVDSQGQWLHGTVPLHPRVQRLFARHLAMDDHGGWEIRLGHQRQPLQVADTPLHVLSAHVQDGPSGRADLILSDGLSEPLQPQRLRQSAQHVLYTWVQRGRWQVPCRFVPQAFYALMLPLVCDEQPDCIRWQSQRYRIGPWRWPPAAAASD